jgi:hypothetical protein
MSVLRLVQTRSEDAAWRPVPGFEGAYKISDQGVVVSLPRVSTAGARKRTIRERALKVTKVVRDGKLEGASVTLTHPVLNQQFHFALARLVLIAFCGEPSNPRMIALTKDRDPLNAKLSNLYWGTFKDAAIVRQGTEMPIKRSQPSQA